MGKRVLKAEEIEIWRLGNGLGARESLRRSYFPRRVWGEFWQGARPALQIVGLTGDRIVAGAV